MKFFITKRQLVSALAKMSEVGTKGIKADYEKSHRVTIQAEESKIVFFTSNGLIDARWEVSSDIDKNLKTESKGEVTVDIIVARKIAEAIGGNKQDVLINVFVQDGDSQSLHMKDADSKAKKTANMVTIAEHHSSTISKPRVSDEKVFRYQFKSEDFRNGISVVSKYVARTNYMPRYRMICIHFLKNEVRFVCGDGACFGILAYKLEQENQDIKDTEGKKFLMPCDQALIIASLCAASSDVEIIYKDPMTCYIKPIGGEDAITMLLKGIPNDQYMNYDKYAFDFASAKTVVDLNKDLYLEGMQLIEAVKDKEKIANQGFHSCEFIVSSSKIEFTVKESRFQADYDMEASVYGSQNFSSCYAHDYLTHVARSSDLPFVRFYCSDSTKTMIAEPVELSDVKNESGFPEIKQQNPRLIFFFAAVVNADDE